MARPLSRSQLRRRREYWEAVDYSDAALNYDAAKLMAVIDDMPRRMRDEINARGLDQNVYDRLPSQWQMRLAEAMGENMTEADVADVWN